MEEPGEVIVSPENINLEDNRYSSKARRFSDYRDTSNSYSNNRTGSRGFNQNSKVSAGRGLERVLPAWLTKQQDTNAVPVQTFTPKEVTKEAPNTNSNSFAVEKNQISDRDRYSSYKPKDKPMVNHQYGNSDSNTKHNFKSTSSIGRGVKSTLPFWMTVIFIIIIRNQKMPYFLLNLIN